MKNKRANGDGSIYFEKSRERWACAIVDPSGKRIVKRFKTEQEAKDYITVTKSSIITNAYIQPSQITFGQWLIDYLELYVVPNAQPGTIRTYTNYCEYADPLNEIPIQKLTANNLQKLINDLPDSLSNTTKNAIGNLFKRALRKAFNTRIIPFNPMNDVNIPKKDKTDVETFSIEEIDSIMQYLSSTPKQSRNYAMFKTAFATGMRIDEILALQKNDIQADGIIVNKTLKKDLNGKIIVGLPKGKKTRIIPVPHSVIALLNKRIPNDNGFLFYSNPHKNLLDITNVQVAWVHILENSGVPYRKIHTIRHTHATQLLENGVSLAEVSKRLGHSSVTITLNTYSHVLNDKSRKDYVKDKVTEIFKF